MSKHRKTGVGETVGVVVTVGRRFIIHLKL